MLITVGELLKKKGREVLSVRPECTVYKALQLMAEKNVGALLVFDSAGMLVGIFSERDYARKLVLKGKFSRTTAVREVMTEDVITVAPEENIEQCMDIMTHRRVRHLPVVHQNKVAGVISIGDIVMAIISDQKFTIDVLERYIAGTR
jgi:CBS domain-containing protein